MNIVGQLNLYYSNSLWLSLGSFSTSRLHFLNYRNTFLRTAASRSSSFFRTSFEKSLGSCELSRRWFSNGRHMGYLPRGIFLFPWHVYIYHLRRCRILRQHRMSHEWLQQSSMMQSFQNWFHRERQLKHRQQSDILEHLRHVHEDSIYMYMYVDKIQTEIRNKVAWGMIEQNIFQSKTVKINLPVEEDSLHCSGSKKEKIKMNCEIYCFILYHIWLK